MPLAIFLLLVGGLIALPDLARPALERQIEQGSQDEQHRAMQLAARIASNYPWKVGFWEIAGKGAVHIRDYPLAIAYLETASDRDGLSAPGWIALGDSYEQLGNLEDALVAWEEALVLDGPAFELLRRQYEVYRKMGDMAGMVQALQSIGEQQPLDAQAQYELGLMLAVHDPQLAIVRLEQAAEQDSAIEPKARMLVRTIRRSSVIAEDPAYRFLEIGRALATLEEWELARRAFELSTLHNPDFAEAWAYLGESDQQLGKGGLAALQKAYRLDPESVAVNSLFALHWARQGRFEFALGYIQTAANAASENPVLQAQLASTLAGLGQVQDAIEVFHRAVALAPNEAVYWRLMAAFSIENDIQIQEVGLPAARMALSLNESDAAALDLIGHAYLVQENTLLAQRFLERALSADPNYAPAHLHIGLVFLSLGESSRARQSLETAIELAPDSVVADRAGQILDQFFP